MSDPVWVRGAAKDDRYVSVGGRELSSHLRYLRGLRAQVERVALLLPARWTTTRPVTEPAIVSAFHALDEALGGVKSAFLLWTGYYKSTLLVGPVRTATAVVFVKVFPCNSEAEAELARIEQLRTIIPASVRLASVDAPGAGVVIYEAMPRSWKPLSVDVLRPVALEIGVSALRQPSESEREVPAHVSSLDVLEGMVGDEVRRTIERELSGGRSALAHGDFTPWNAFRSPDQRTCLVDYENVGLRPPFFDAVHLETQPAAVAGHGVDLRPLIRTIAEAAGVPIAEAAGWARASTADSILDTTRAHQAFSANRARSLPLLRAKISTFTEALAAGV